MTHPSVLVPHRRGVRLAAVALAVLGLLLAGWSVAGGAQNVPGSSGRGALYHLRIGTDVAEGTGSRTEAIIQDGTDFPSGTERLLFFQGWAGLPRDTVLRLQVYRGDRLIFDEPHAVVHQYAEDDGDNVGFIWTLEEPGGLEDGAYDAVVLTNGVFEEWVPFSIGDDAPPPAAAYGDGVERGPIPYADPDEVLVVTRTAVLRAKLGPFADAVLAAAGRVGDLHDLEADGSTRDTPEAAAAEVHRLLGAGDYRYLLILGNDDTVPFFRVDNPMAEDESADLEDWDLPADWLPSDDPYADLDADEHGIPDLAVARIPSSEDAFLLLTQLGDLTPPDGGAVALVNHERKSHAGLIVGIMADMVRVDLRYAPPTTAEAYAADPQVRSARYLYTLLHGIGVETGAWSVPGQSWERFEGDTGPDAEWVLTAVRNVDAVTVATSPVGHGVVFVGACYGAWTLDTTQEPQHKTAANSLALHYLKGGTRAFIADTHLSYSYSLGGSETPVGRSGFEKLFFTALGDGMTPIDAFQAAKVGIGEAIDDLLQAGRVDRALINLKTLHYMVYLGRP